MVHENSRTAYKEKVLPTLSDREKEVYGFIYLYGEITAWEVAIKMSTKERRVTPNQISGRFRPMETKGFIKCIGKRLINGSKHDVWATVKPNPVYQAGQQLTI
jgi:hypothetical protein